MEPQKVTIAALQKKKEAGKKITMMTAYDYPTANLVDQAGIDTILVEIPWEWLCWVMNLLSR